MGYDCLSMSSGSSLDALTSFMSDQGLNRPLMELRVSDSRLNAVAQLWQRLAN